MRAITLAGAMLLPVLSACVSIDGDACVDPDTAISPVVSTKADVTPRNCDGNFLSARRQRTLLYGGNDAPRLYTGEAPRTGPLVDTSRVNRPPGGQALPATGYLGSLRIDYPADEATTAADTASLQAANGPRFDADQRVTVNFKKATIDFVLKQMLGGALGLNYIAPEDLGGSITFRTEEPLPKSQILQVVRDLLGRNGLELRNINGIYHVGRPELLASMESIGRAGAAADQVSRIVRLRKGSAAEALALARQILPPDVQVIRTNAADTLILRAAPGQIDQAQAILKKFAESGANEDRVAVIPLRHSPPDKIAGQLMEFYRNQNSDPITIVPLDQQQGLLISSRNPSVLAGARQLAQAMDAEVRDEYAVRLVPLKHLPADEVAQKLNQIYGQGGGAALQGAAAGRGAPPVPRRGPPLSDIAPDPMSAGGFPRAPRIAAADEPDVPPGPRRGGESGSPLYPSAGPSVGAGAGTPPVAGQTRVVAESRSNSVVISSSYETFRRVRDLLRALDIPPSQVVIEATVVEVTLNDGLESGVQFFLSGRGFTVGSGDIGNNFGGNGSSTGTPTSGSVGGIGQGGVTGSGGLISVGANLGNGVRADAVLRALQAVTRVKVISSPYLTVANNKQARLVIGDQIPYARRTQSANNLGVNTTTNEVETKDTGIILDVTPQINSDNSVALRIAQTVSTPLQSAQAGLELTPVIATRSVESDVVLQSGRTVLLAGLIQDRMEQQEGGVPVLRTVPVVGDFFKSRTDQVRRVELILLLTPRVVRAPSQIEDLTRLLQAQIHTR